MFLDYRQHDMQRAPGFLKGLSTLAPDIVPGDGIAGMVSERRFAAGSFLFILVDN